MEPTRKQTFENKFIPLHFGTSGIRALVTEMTDMECYINTRGFVKFLKKINGIKNGSQIAIACDLRKSSMRIISAVHRAIIDEKCEVIDCGLIPTPTLSYYAWKRKIPAVMVTGSHIPDELNGIKFIKSTSEVLKSDEKDILDNVAVAREEEYLKNETVSVFDMEGSFKQEAKFITFSEQENAINEFEERYTGIFPHDSLAGKKIALYEHSAVGREMLGNILTSLGAEVIRTGKSEKFIPIDTEKIPGFVTESLKNWSKEFKPFAIVSTDGDSDRPLVADENGIFLPGDLLGLLVSLFLKPDFISIPISANDGIFTILKNLNIEFTLTKIGSPYCIDAMNKKLIENPNAKVASWERNGGYLLGNNWSVNEKVLTSLPTRDSILPILIALIFATKENTTLSDLIKTKLPHRFITSDAIDDKTKGCELYTTIIGKKIISAFSPKDTTIKEINFCENSDEETRKIKIALETYFDTTLGYTPIKSINYIDGVRISFENNDVVHLRPSSNAPEFRMYVTADTEERANKMLADRLIILPKIIADKTLL